MQKTSKRRAPCSENISQSQLSFTGFETPFCNGLVPTNRWVELSSRIPWDVLVNLFNKDNPPKSTGRPSLNPGVWIVAAFIKHMLNIADRETIAQIKENMYLQYFLGYTAYIKEPLFDASLFVDIRKRMGEELIAEMNQKIQKYLMEQNGKKKIKQLAQNMMGLM